MTGFGRADGPLGLSAEVRSVNSRHLEVRVRLPRELAALERDARAAATGFFERGQVEISLRLPQEGELAPKLELDPTADARHGDLRRHRSTYALELHAQRERRPQTSIGALGVDVRVHGLRSDERRAAELHADVRELDIGAPRRGIDRGGRAHFDVLHALGLVGLVHHEPHVAHDDVLERELESAALSGRALSFFAAVALCPAHEILEIGAAALDPATVDRHLADAHLAVPPRRAIERDMGGIDAHDRRFRIANDDTRHGDVVHRELDASDGDRQIEATFEALDDRPMSVVASPTRREHQHDAGDHDPDAERGEQPDPRARGWLG